MTDAISMKELPKNIQKKMKTLVGTSGKTSDDLLKEYNVILNSKDLKNLETNIKYEKAYVILRNRYCDTNTVPLMNDGKEIAVLHIIGRNKFQIKDDNDKIVYPPTSVTKKGIVWYTSDFHRGKIARKLELKLKLTKEKATIITDILCGNVDEKIRQLEKSGFFKKHIEADNQTALDSIDSASLIGKDDGNIYNISVKDPEDEGNKKTIHLTDKQFYDEPKEFCLKYLTCFRKMIKITPDEWDEFFIPKIFSVLETETDEIESTCDMITQKFIHYIKNKNTYDWEDMATRKHHKKCIFFDTQHNFVWISREFIDDFFIREKITRDYKKTQGDWNSHLHRKEDRYLIEKSKTGRTKTNEVKRFWIFDPEKIAISKDEIKKKEEPEEIESQTVNKYYNKIKPVED